MHAFQAIETKYHGPTDTKGREIFSSGRYFASAHSFGLVIQNHRTGKRKMLPVSHDQFNDYVEAIETAIDSTEADMLCRALLASK